MSNGFLEKFLNQSTQFILLEKYQFVLPLFTMFHTFSLKQFF